MIYDYEEENTFFGGNEFRYFDTRSLRFYSDRIDSIAFNDSIHHVWLLSDYKRTFDNYAIIPDINGKFIIKSQEGWDSEMIAYPHVFKLNNKILMFYLGNDVGRYGFGLAQLDET